MERILRIFTGWIFICILQTAFSAYATTFYVSKSGADESGRDGSASEPWLTIGYAVGRAEVGTGDVIEVGDGVYEENIPIYKSIILQGATAPSPPSIVGAVLGGPGASGGHFDLRANNITVDGFTFDEQPSPGIGVVNSTSGHTITNNYFYKRGRGIFFGDGSGACTVTNNTIDQSRECGLFIGDTGGHTIQGNTISNSGDHAIDIRNSVTMTVTISNGNQITGSTNNGINLSGPATVDGNTITGNGANGISINGDATDVTVSNNTQISSNGEHGVRIGGSTTLQGNTIQSNSSCGVFIDGQAIMRGNTIENNTDSGVKIASPSSIDLGQDNDAEAGNNIIRNNTNWNVVNMTEYAVSAYRNYWGMTDASAIDATIEDDDEDSYRGAVNFNPFLTEEPSAVDLPVGEQKPEFTRIIQAYPNPFNPETRIQYTLAENANVTLRVMDVTGRTVQTIIQNQQQLAGGYSVHWNGKDDSGCMASSGTYLLVLKAGDIYKTQKVMLVR
ncbi:right-handed parallel beta-helix repeat-containing protein [candidate division KSB1 bacterium]|nr:right-handed parallel beta-helix repeat-containing protein [candidate division KSB1 bacterium]